MTSARTIHDDASARGHSCSAEALVDAALAGEDRARVTNAPAGAGKTGAVVTLCGRQAEEGAQVGAIAQTNAQAFDIVHRTAVSFPDLQVGFLPAEDPRHRPDVEIGRQAGRPRRFVDARRGARAGGGIGKLGDDRVPHRIVPPIEERERRLRPAITEQGREQRDRRFLGEAPGREIERVYVDRHSAAGNRNMLSVEAGRPAELDSFSICEQVLGGEGTGYLGVCKKSRYAAVHVELRVRDRGARARGQVVELGAVLPQRGGQRLEQRQVVVGSDREELRLVDVRVPPVELFWGYVDQADDELGAVRERDVGRVAGGTLEGAGADHVGAGLAGDVADRVVPLLRVVAGRGVVGHQRVTSLADPGREQVYFAERFVGGNANRWANLE